MLQVEDTLMKWTAEYTQRNPWNWVIFEDVITILNLPENMDRAIQDAPRFRSGTAEDSQSLHGRIHRFEADDSSEEENETTRKVGEWEPVFEAILRSNSWVMVRGAAKRFRRRTLNAGSQVSGEPGIGKTFFLKEFMEREEVKKEYPRMRRIDGSSDRFVREAITDVLDDLVESACGQSFLLCLDEYHMCTAQQKVQLLAWAKQHSESVKLVMISNRLDQVRVDLPL
jgi:predicted ATPase